MERDMSYELDGMFSGRNAGELVAVRQTRTRIKRSPGLAPVARMAGGDVRNLTPAIANRIPRSHVRNIVRPGYRSMSIPLAKSLSMPIFKQPGDLADYDAAYDMPFDGISGALGLPDTINVPVIGPVNTMVAIAGGAVAAFALFKLIKR